MINYDKFSELKQFTDSVGQVYGTEDFAIYLYSIVKMTRPSLIVELGTGFGTTALWIAQALKENNIGKLVTVDNGIEWNGIKDSIKKENIFNNHYKDDYKECISDIFKYFGVSDQVNFVTETITKINPGAPIDILFSDYAHGSFDIVKLVADYLTSMSDNSKIYIDSASTKYSSYQTLESLISILNTGRVPYTLLELLAITDREKFINRVQNTKFELEHIIENKQRAQNSTACIKLSPLDIMPQPRIGIRF